MIMDHYTNKDALKASSQVEVIDCTINTDDSKMFHILSNLYSRPLDAVIRELSTNCLDGHRISGNTDKPFEIHLNDDIFADENSITFIDYGPGMDKATIVDVFSSFGTSTKDKSNDQTGCLGLGSKSPLAIANTFTVFSRKDGNEMIFNITKDSSGKPKTMFLNESKTDKPNGLSINIPINEKQFSTSTIIESIKHELIFFSIKPKVYKDHKEITGIFRTNFTSVTNNFYITTSGDYIYDFNAVQGGVKYPISISQFLNKLNKNSSLKDFEYNDIDVSDELYEFLKKFLTRRKYKSFKNIFFFNIGSLDFTPSRESLMYTPHTIKNLLEVITFSLLNYTQYHLKQLSLINSKYFVYDLNYSKKLSVDHISDYRGLDFIYIKNATKLIFNNDDKITFVNGTFIINNCTNYSKFNNKLIDIANKHFENKGKKLVSKDVKIPFYIKPYTSYKQKDYDFFPPEDNIFGNLKIIYYNKSLEKLNLYNFTDKVFRNYDKNLGKFFSKIKFETYTKEANPQELLSFVLVDSNLKYVDERLKQYKEENDCDYRQFIIIKVNKDTDKKWINIIYKQLSKQLSFDYDYIKDTIIDLKKIKLPKKIIDTLEKHNIKEDRNTNEKYLYRTISVSSLISNSEYFIKDTSISSSNKLYGSDDDMVDFVSKGYFAIPIAGNKTLFNLEEQLEGKINILQKKSIKKFSNCSDLNKIRKTLTLLNDFGLIDKPHCKIILLSQRNIKKFGFKTIDKAYIETFNSIIGKKYTVNNIIDTNLNEKVDKFKNLQFIDNNRSLDIKLISQKFHSEKHIILKNFINKIKPLKELIPIVNLQDKTIDIVSDYNYYINLKNLIVIFPIIDLFGKKYNIVKIKRLLKVFGIKLNIVENRPSLNIKNYNLRTSLNNLITFRLAFINDDKDLEDMLYKKILNINKEIFLINNNFNITIFKNKKLQEK